MRSFAGLFLLGLLLLGGRSYAGPLAEYVGGGATMSRASLGVSEVVTHTRYVEDIAVDAGSAWVATRGGLELYELLSGQRQKVFTTSDGLAEIHVREVRAVAGRVEARTLSHRCYLEGGRFVCASAARLEMPEPVIAPLFEGARVTARASVVGGVLIGTAGRGVWLRRDGQPDAPVRLTPDGQICSNHMMGMAVFQDALYLGSFDEGLCVFDGQGFRRLETGFRMVNDVLATPYGLFVASSGGLFRSVDGSTFEKVGFVNASGVNGLAFDGSTLYATTPATLWQIPLVKRDALGRRLLRRQHWLPGGARAVQKVAVGSGSVWLASEDRGVIRFANGQFQVLDRAAGLPTSWVMDVSVANDTLYAATFRHGLVSLTLDAHGTPRLESARTLAGLPDAWLLRVELLDGALWVGTQQGAARIDDREVATTPALPHPCVHAMERFDGATWLATEGGLVRLANE